LLERCLKDRFTLAIQATDQDEQQEFKHLADQRNDGCVPEIEQVEQCRAECSFTVGERQATLQNVVQVVISGRQQ